MKVSLVIELYLDETWGEDDASIQWLIDKVITKENLSLHSNEIGDQVGEITEVGISYIKH